MQVRINGTEAESVDGLYRQHSAMSGYVSISSEMTGLPDNTRGKIGRYVVYLQHPDAIVSAELLEGALRFSEAVSKARLEKEQARFDAEIEREEQQYKRVPKGTFPYRTSDEAWEAEDEETWAKMARAGL